MLGHFWMYWNMSDLSVIIPIYNSSRYIDASLSDVVRAFREKSLSLEIVVCDDASTDTSWNVLQGIAEKNECVKLMRNENNQGLGATLKRLVAAASSECVIYCDVDLPFAAAGVCAVYDQMREADIVVASRYLGGAAHIPFGRKVCSRGYWLMACWLQDVRVRDIGSGTVGFPRSEFLALNLESNGFDIHLEFFVKAHDRGLRIKEISLDSRKGTPGSFSILRHGPQVVKRMFQLWQSSGYKIYLR